MGCANSKQKSRCRHCQNSPYLPVSRSYSMHVHHPPQTKGDTYHVVALTSSTLGSLKLDPSLQNHHIDNKIIANGNHVENKIFPDGGNGQDNNGHHHLVKENALIGNGHESGENENEKEKEKENEHENDNKKEFSMGLIEAKTWSNMINQKIPKVVPRTPIRTPPGEPETINTWELMEGLEDVSPYRSPTHHLRSFSFDVVRDPCPMPIAPVDRPKSELQENGNVSPKPMWLQLAGGDDVHVTSQSLISDFDPEVISAFRKSLSELNSDDDPFHFSQFGVEKMQPAWACKDLLLDDEEVNGAIKDVNNKDRDRIVLYFTSLRGVRKTYEDCCHVRVILKGIGVRVDERDVSMHSGFKDELKELLKDGFSGAALPRVFLGNKYIGGADEIRQLHEDGKLEKLLQCCEKLNENGGGCGGGGGGVCDACGDIRFVPCETCSGSCKIYYEDADRDEGDEEEEEEEAEEGESGFQRCPDCNENGLIRCPICCY